MKLKPQWLTNFLQWIKPRAQGEKPAAKKAYFDQAQSWADDYYALAVASRNRYRIAFLSVAALCVVLVFGLIEVTTSSNVQLVVVHTGPSGYSWVKTIKPKTHIPMSWARTQSEIRSYILARESFDPFLHEHQMHQVMEMSGDLVRSQYLVSQSKKSKTAFVNLIGAKGYRTVQVKSILKVEDGKNQNLAQVSFVATDHFFESNRVFKTQYSALIAWTYHGVPQDPEKMLQNWDGFTVVRYEVQLENGN